jgi:hypothetical protein
VLVALVLVLVMVMVMVMVLLATLGRPSRADAAY